MLTSNDIQPSFTPTMFKFCNLLWVTHISGTINISC